MSPLRTYSRECAAPRAAGRMCGTRRWLGVAPAGQPWQEHPVAALTALTIAPVDGDLIETVAGGG